jgi:tRNA threonylcarbamoyladenosine biosynthesis protein TsaE
MIKYESNSPEESFAIGLELGKNAYIGQVICLVGELGVGKTIFTKGFAKGLGINEEVTSPTFTIVNEYDDGRLPFYHFDVYRIEDPYEMEEIGYEEYFYGKGVTFVEWANLIEELIPKASLWIRISKNLEKGFDFRQIEISEGDYDSFRN